MTFKNIIYNDSSEIAHIIALTIFILFYNKKFSVHLVVVHCRFVTHEYFIYAKCPLRDSCNTNSRARTINFPSVQPFSPHSVFVAFSFILKCAIKVGFDPPSDGNEQVQKDKEHRLGSRGNVKVARRSTEGREATCNGRKNTPGSCSTTS